MRWKFHEKNVKWEMAISVSCKSVTNETTDGENWLLKRPSFTIGVNRNGSGVSVASERLLVFVHYLYLCTRAIKP